MYNVVLTDGRTINLHQEMSYESIIKKMSRAATLLNMDGGYIVDDVNPLRRMIDFIAF